MTLWERHILHFKNHLRLERSLAGNSVEAYIHDIEKFSAFLASRELDVAAEAVEPLHITDFIENLNEMNMTPLSQARILSGIKAFYRYLMYEELTDRDPTALIEGPRIGRKLPDTLEFNEIEKLLNTIDLSTPEGARNRAMLETLYCSGLRVSELIDLRISHIYADSGFLRVLGKGNKERLVPVGKDALKYIKIYLEEIRPVVPVKPGHENIAFLNRRGAKLTRVMIFTIIKNLALRAEIYKKISPHTFRHSFATHMIEGGADLRVVQEILGHESITTTEIYTHLDREYLQQVITDFHPRSKK